FAVLVASWVLALAQGLALSGPGSPDEQAKQLMEQAQALEKEKKIDDALRLMRKAIDLAPKNDTCLAYTSHLERLAGQFADGLRHALEAVKLNDQVGFYYVLVAVNAYGDQELELARAYCKKALDKGPEGVGPVNYALTQFIQDLITEKTYTIVWNLQPDKKVTPGAAVAVAVPKGDLPYQKVAYEVTGA